jgi:hypothetical protein
MEAMNRRRLPVKALPRSVDESSHGYHAISARLSFIVALFRLKAICRFIPTPRRYA